MGRTQRTQEGGERSVQEVQGSLTGSAKQMVEIVVGSDPNPNDGVGPAFTDGAVLLVNADRPEVFVAAQFFEPERRMGWILSKESIGAPRRVAHSRAQVIVGALKTGPDH